MAISIQVDTKEFNAALREYIKVSRRTLPEIVNKRAVNIAFKSIRWTRKARKSQINRDLKQKARIAPKAPIGAILVNYKAGQDGEKGFYGDKMKQQVERMKLARHSSAGYIKAGWLGAFRDLQPHAKVFRRPPRGLGSGNAAKKGFGRPAKRGINPTAEIVNQVEGAVKIGAPGLQRAMNADAADMAQFAAKRMQQDANKFKR